MLRNHPEVVALAIITVVLTLLPLAQNVSPSRYRVLRVSGHPVWVQEAPPSSCELTRQILESLGR